MLYSWIETINRIRQLLITNSAAIGIDPDYILISNSFGIDTPAPFIMLGAEWIRKVSHNASVAEIRVTVRIGAESSSNAEASELVMQLINKVCNVMDANGYTLDNVEPVYFSADRTIFDCDYPVQIKVFNYLTEQEQSQLHSTIMS